MQLLVVIAVLVSAGLAAGAVASHAESQGLQQQPQKILKAAPRAITPKATISTTTVATPTTSALTAGECKGLGGSVVANNICAKSGMPTACKTVDADGVVRVMCIDGVKN